jgi:hypothetical protein
MVLLLVFIGLALFAFAALRWGADTTDTVDSPEWQHRRLWTGMSGVNVAARLGAVLAPLSYPTAAGLISGVTLPGPMDLLLLEAAAPPPTLDLRTHPTQENVTPEAAHPAPAAGVFARGGRAKAKRELVWVWPAN